MDEVAGPRSNFVNDMSEEEIQNANMSEDEIQRETNIICDLETFVNHENNINKSEGSNMSKRPQKRIRNSSEETDDKALQEEGFTVVRSKNKKMATRNTFQPYSAEKQTLTDIDLNCFEVCITSMEVLPKQIGMAKLLKKENILNITHIKYKSPYKIIMKFENKIDAEKLINNSKFQNLGYRCRLTNEVGMSYGVVKYIELDMKEEELLKSFKCETEIVSIKRLKRLNDSGQWTDSETVRFCFKGSSLPQYVYGYDCRFKIDPYTFPVTQCSVCWIFGHVARVCPSKKQKCPKCSGNHGNCETTKFTCVNCKEDHVAFYKGCPMFLKEKSIRQIMCKENCTYKVALAKYLQKQKLNKASEKRLQQRDYGGYNLSQQMHHQITTEAVIHENSMHTENGLESERICGTGSSTDDLGSTENLNRKQKKHKKKKRLTNESVEQVQYSEVVKGHNKPKQSTLFLKSQERKKNEDERKKKEYYIENDLSFEHILRSLESIFLAPITFNEKLTQMLTLVIENVKKIFIKTLSNGDIIRKLISVFYNG